MKKYTKRFMKWIKKGDRVVILLIIITLLECIGTIVDARLDGYRHAEKVGHTYYAHIPDEYVETDKYVDTYDGQRIIKVDGKSLEPGETAVFRVN